MARTTPVKKAWRALTWLLIITIGMFALNAVGILGGKDNEWSKDASWDLKLALDLEGGTQIILAPRLESGQQVSEEQLAQAVAIMRQRVDASGVAEAEITTQGTGSGTNVVVTIPGTPDEETLQRIQSSATLDFRPVLRSEVAPASAVGGEGDGSTSSPTPTPDVPLENNPSVEPTDASDENWITPALLDTYTNFDCGSVDAADANVAPSGEPLVACDDLGQYKYLLGPVEVAGKNIADASSSLVANSQGASTGQWGVNIVFDSVGTEKFSEMTTRLYSYGAGTSVRNQFAIVLDGRVISAPTTNAVITDGKPQITGSFTQETAKSLGDQLKFGALPIGFQVQSQEIISATLGESQLQSGLIAGLIGLILVILYSLFQYRLLGLVTVASLVVAGVITYIALALLSWREGYRLSLAGVAGIIVAIGFTADSFIVYFERIRDELRDGRQLESAVEAGWKRALRTIYAAKAVNLLSAAVLFILAVGNVRGFALTLGLTTIIDVLVVVLFTHPLLQLLAKTKYFSSGHPLSGLDPNALGAVYRGRAQFREPAVAGVRSGANREAVRRQTIAERKAAELAESSRPDTKAKKTSSSKTQKNDGKDS
ncbi:protein translocase subunit SecD [Glaciihabitans arcticus]|uniref:Protein translocase subunit SecD n=1 Tax=Glaciihabitans arcticus TaxID=2668039 RepID=A0A4Q9GVT7_9MICO|nr:protein translocase subunit SecD [Glaciihabitans arcticus]TBN56783.1 protein translocase subunit SecD [Glaciihabitans arcticus]